MKKTVIDKDVLKEKVENFKRFGLEHVFPQRLQKWNDMIDDFANIKYIVPLQTAVYAMNDLDAGVDHNIIEYGLSFMCREPATQAVVHNVLLNFAKKGPDFLLKSGLFQPFDADSKVALEWQKHVMEAKRNNEEMEEYLQNNNL